MEAATWALVGASVLGTAASTVTSSMSMEQSKDAAKKQEEAINKAKAEQEAADNEAELDRLEALATDQTKTDYGNVWGVDDKLTNKYADVAQKLSAGTGSTSSDDEDNPFYSKGLF